MVASIEAPFPFLEEPVEILGLDPVETPKTALRLVPEIFDSVDMILGVGEQFGMVDPTVMKFGHVKGIVGIECVGVDDAIGLDLLLDDRQQGLGSGVRDDRRVDLAAPLQKPENSDFPGCTPAALALPDPAKVAFVGLDLAGQFEGRLFAGDQNSQPLVETNRSVCLNADNLRCSASRRSRNEVLDQFPLLPRFKSASALIHSSQSRSPDLP